MRRLSLLLIALSAIAVNGCAIPKPLTGPIILAGGGSESEPGDPSSWSARLYRHFLDGGDITGDGKIKIALLAAGDQSDWLPRYFKWLGASDAVNVKLDSTAAADDPALDARFADIDAIFIKGGDQGRYYDLWNDRRIERIIRGIARRRGAVGGTSAGAMSMAEFALTGGKSLTSLHALADSHTPMLDDDSDGGSGIHRNFLAFVPGVVIDTHFTQRNRFGRMLATCAKALEDFHLPQIRGIGLDEKTGLLIRANTAECIGVGTVTILTASRDAPLRRGTGHPLAWTDLRFDQLIDGSRINLASGKVELPAPK